MSDLTDELIADARERMGKSIEQTQHEFQSVRTGRASPAILDRVVVDYFGVATPLRSLATINAPEARLLTVQPFDPSTMKLLEKAISDSGVGLNPSNDGKVMRLSVPELNEERRRELVKVARGIAEEGRIKIRNIRRDTMKDLKELKDSGDVGEDDEKRAEAETQKVTDEKVAVLENALKVKEAEILEV